MPLAGIFFLAPIARRFHHICCITGLAEIGIFRGNEPYFRTGLLQRKNLQLTAQRRALAEVSKLYSDMRITALACLIFPGMSTDLTQILSCLSA
jgi:hypothetical protein